MRALWEIHALTGENASETAETPAVCAPSDSKAKIEYLRMRLMKLKQSKEVAAQGESDTGSAGRIADNSCPVFPGAS